MERVTFKNSRNLSLAGIFYQFKSNKAIVVAHGLLANKDRPRLVELSDAFNKAGFAVLRFDFSACGESDADLVTVGNEVDDLKAAISFIASKGFKEIGIWGESLGGLVSLMAFSDRIKAMVLWAPVTDKKVPAFEKSYKRPDGQFVVQKDGREFKIGDEYFGVRKSVNPKTLLSRISIPILIIHGDADEEIPLEWSKHAMTLLPPKSHLLIIKGLGHKPGPKLDEVINSSIEWFKSHL